MIHHGDCLEVMPTLPAESIDSIVTDPPYGLSFMGKNWDHGIPGVAFWSEALRVAKPGAHLLAFGGTRTFHRLTCAIEDAGWEIRDCIMWVYGSGFTKGFNLNRVPQCCCISSGNMLPYDHEKRTESDTEYDVRFVPNGNLSQTIDNDPKRWEVLQPEMQEPGTPIEEWGELPRTEARRSEPGLEGRKVHRTGKGLCNGQNARSSTGTGERVCSGTYRGDGIEDWATTDGDRGSSPYQSQSSGQQAGKLGTIREPQGSLDAGALRGRGQCPRCGKLKKEFAGFSTSLKPAWEPIIVARKPIAGTVAQNVQEYGTGAVNVDGCRIDAGRDYTSGAHDESVKIGGSVYGWAKSQKYQRCKPNGSGRWPANLIHDGSDEVVGLFPSGSPPKLGRTGKKGGSGFGNFDDQKTAVTYGVWPPDPGGSAARFFYCAKASKADRDEGCDGLEERAKKVSVIQTEGVGLHGHSEDGKQISKARNHHPTVKPTDLMRYLCRLVTPSGGTVLDPFCGSGSTGKAATLEGFEFIGIEREAEYVAIAQARIAHARGDMPLLEAVR